jgi:hypothetical protein
LRSGCVRCILGEDVVVLLEVGHMSLSFGRITGNDEDLPVTRRGECV